jgi:hypothetical protein
MASRASVPWHHACVHKARIAGQQRAGLCGVMRSYADRASGRQDLNLRPLGPQPSALPDCATPRGCLHSDVLPPSGGPRLSRTSVRLARSEHAALWAVWKRKTRGEFAWRRKARDQRDNYCRPCRAAYKHAHYAANRQRYIDAAGRRRESLVDERTRFIVAYLREHPCVDCGERDPIVLEFDHLRDKLFGVAAGLRERSWQSVLREMAKCEVVCANCHRRRTAKRGGFARAAVAQW